MGLIDMPNVIVEDAHYLVSLAQADAKSARQRIVDSFRPRSSDDKPYLKGIEKELKTFNNLRRRIESTTASGCRELLRAVDRPAPHHRDDSGSHRDSLSTGDDATDLLVELLRRVENEQRKEVRALEDWIQRSKVTQAHAITSMKTVSKNGSFKRIYHEDAEHARHSAELCEAEIKALCLPLLGTCEALKRFQKVAASMGQRRHPAIRIDPYTPISPREQRNGQP